MFQSDIEFIQNQIGYKFDNSDLLQQAFVRRSYSQEKGGEDNEVLEFIGDKVLDLIVVKLLIAKYGFMTSKRNDFDYNDAYSLFCYANEFLPISVNKGMTGTVILSGYVNAT